MSPINADRELTVFVADEQSEIAIDCNRWATLGRLALESQGMRGPAELSLLFVDETTIEALAERFLDHHGPTDVLSFPIEDDPAPSGRNPDGGGRGPGWEDGGEQIPIMLGDVVICPTVAATNAPEHLGPGHNGSCEDEIALLVVHGILHILGMDHEIESEAQEMEALEQKLLDAHYRSSTPSNSQSTRLERNITAREATTEVANEPS